MSEVIKRFEAEIGQSGWVVPSPDGDYVLYTDHAEAMREKEAAMLEMVEEHVLNLERARQMVERAEAQRDALIADRDSWADQASARVEDWDNERKAKERALAVIAAVVKELDFLDMSEEPPPLTGIDLAIDQAIKGIRSAIASAEKVEG